uniref:Uncharacterized protein n=1 Tax=Oryza meridionalis TaxID=40149 RepID=A0A0E0DXL3_9ORYZ
MAEVCLLASRSSSIDAGLVHDNKVSIVEKLCSICLSGCCVGAPYNFAISRKAKVPSFWKVSLEPLPFTGASRFAVQATVFSDDLENQMEKVKALVATL